MADLKEMLTEREWLLADGATGTNYFAMGLQSGEPPENWNISHPDRVRDLHRRFIEAGSDIILTNTFGANPRRLMLHGAAEQTHEINKQAAQHTRAEAEAAGKPVLVAGSMGPTTDLMASMTLKPLKQPATSRNFAQNSSKSCASEARRHWRSSNDPMTLPGKTRSFPDQTTDCGRNMLQSRSNAHSGAALLAILLAAK